MSVKVNFLFLLLKGENNLNVIMRYISFKNALPVLMLMTAANIVDLVKIK